MEQKMLARLRGLQQSYAELTDREAKLSQAKFELSRERLELQQLRKQLRQTRCSLCKIGDQSKEMSDLLTKGDPEPLSRIGTDRVDRVPTVDEILQADSISDKLSRSNFQVDLDNLPNLTDLSTNSFDPDLLLVKLDLMNTRKVLWEWVFNDNEKKGNK